MSRPPKKALLPAAPVNFLLGCSDADLGEYLLARLSSVANLRGQLLEILDKMVEETSASALAEWFRTQDRIALKDAIENPAEMIERIVAQAKEGIRDGQRSAEELIPRAPLPPGSAHIAANLRYTARNIAEGKCGVCPQPLDPRSHRYCTKHLAMQRERHVPKRKRTEPGTVAWLYGETLTPGDGRSTPKVYQKHRRLTDAGKDFLKRIAKECGATYEHVRRVAIGDMRSDRISDAITKELETPRQEVNEKRKGSKAQRKNEALLTVLRGAEKP